MTIDENSRTLFRESLKEHVRATKTLYLRTLFEDIESFIQAGVPVKKIVDRLNAQFGLNLTVGAFNTIMTRLRKQRARDPKKNAGNIAEEKKPPSPQSSNAATPTRNSNPAENSTGFVPSPRKKTERMSWNELKKQPLDL